MEKKLVKRHKVISCFYWKDMRRCNHPEAPNPGHSYCIGRDNCTSCYEWRWSEKHRKETGLKELIRIGNLKEKPDA